LWLIFEEFSMNKAGRKVIVGSRGSKLALIQTETIVRRLRAVAPSLEFVCKVIKTQGDREGHRSLDEIGGQGVFVKALEQALLSRAIDLAVHSLKDVPGEVSPGLQLAAVISRDDPRDVLVSTKALPLTQMPSRSRIGTGSHRRIAQVKAVRPDLETCPIRGNVDTRLRKVRTGEVDGVILAAAALLRMGWQDRITEYLSPEVFLPAVGQGALAVEVRTADMEMIELAVDINDSTTWHCTAAERAFLRTLGGGCSVPIAALGTVEDDTVRLEGMMASTDYTRMIRHAANGPASDAVGLGQSLAEKILSMGGDKLIAVDEGRDGTAG
jgi:hydroxymethylbilane synthase